MKKKWLIIFLLGLWYSHSVAQVIIPSPEKCIPGEGIYSFANEARCLLEVAEANWTIYFKDILLREAGYTFKKIKKGKTDFHFMKASHLNPEAYILHIDCKGIKVTAGGEQGFFYAIQTLRQLMESNPEGRGYWRYIHIEDQPRYHWRSFMLDSGRQYQKVTTIKKYIDMAAILKMNYFHWHLTEGLGWRIEIKKYPRLAQVGGFVGKGPEQQGFYSQEEIREIIKYAEERYITIVPEIDMPGHAEAALTAYPEMGCFGKIPKIPEQGFTHNIFCVSKTSTLRFLQDILNEVCLLFPSSYIHLGGDEAPKNNWDICPDCQAKIKQEGLKNSHNLQAWFSHQMAVYLKQKDRKAIFWDDIMEGSTYKLPDNVIVHWWNWRAKQERPFNEALKRGHKIICGTNYYTYLNFPLTPWKGYKTARTFNIRDIYEKNPSMNRDKHSQVLGMSCALWTDYGLTENLLDQRLFPRILALAEQMWHPGEYLPFETFCQQILKKQKWFEKLGYKFGPDLKSEVLN